MDAPSRKFVLGGSLEELKSKGRLVLHGNHRPILVIYDRGRVFALDNRCPHMGFPLERGSVEDGIQFMVTMNPAFDSILPSLACGAIAKSAMTRFLNTATYFR